MSPRLYGRVLWGAVQMKVPARLNNYPGSQVRVEFRVEFKESDWGVRCLAGIGRHCGIGLFAAARESNEVIAMNGI